jgi:fumarate reductase (CoM/CoB) subunit B
MPWAGTSGEMPELAEGVRLEIACAGKTGTVGSNPTLSAMISFMDGKKGEKAMGHAKALAYCAYCPKLCHSSCPVSEATARETFTPWGKQSILFEVERGILPMTDEYAAVFYACLECHRCMTWCEHGVDVPASLRMGRTGAFDAGVTPPAVQAMHARFAERETLARKILEKKFPLVTHGGSRKLTLMPGCVTALRDLKSVESAMMILQHLAGEEFGMFSRLCCGLPLLHAGDMNGFKVAARGVADALRETRTVVVMDPGCAVTMTAHYREAGVDLAPRVITLPQFAADYISHFRGKINLPQPVVYHDPCHLGRDLGVYSEPRDILMKIVSGGIREIQPGRDASLCCGGGGAVPETMPAAAETIAGRLANVIRRSGAASVVTACPTCKSMIARAGPGLEVHDIADLLSRAL